MRKPQRHTKKNRISVRFTAEDAKRVEQAAARAQKYSAEWLRDLALDQIKIKEEGGRR